MTLRYEAWTLPWSAEFKRVVARIPVIEGAGTGEARLSSTAGTGSADISLAGLAWRDPATSRLNTIISPTVGTLISVFDGATLVDEWLAEKVAHQHSDENPVAGVSGNVLMSVFDKIAVYPKDYPKQPSLDPDWVWGGPSAGLRNGGFEDHPLAIANPGFEDGTLAPWWAGAVAGVSANAAIVTGANVDTGTYAAAVTPLKAEGGASTSVAVRVQSTYQVTIRFKAGTGVDYQFGATGRQGITPLGGAILVDFGTLGWEAQKLFVSTGSYQTVTLDFRTGDDTSIQLNIREGEAVLNGQTFYYDIVAITGDGIGVAPWQTRGVGSFHATDTIADTGTWSGFAESVLGAGQGQIYQVISVRPGTAYTATVRLRTPGTGTVWALEARDITGRLIGQTPLALTANTFTTFVLAFTTPDFLPGAGSAIELRVVNYTGTTPSSTEDVYIDGADLAVGDPISTIGVIALALLNDAALDHAADPRGAPLFWVDFSSITTTLDSSGNAWDREHSFTAPATASMGQIFDKWVDLGYEYELVRKAVPVGVLTHDFKLYNPGGRDDAPSTALQPRQGTIGGSAASRIPQYTATLLMGQNGLWREDVDGTAETNFGRLERPGSDTNLGSLISLESWSDELFAFEAANRNAVQFGTIATPDHPRPLVAFRPGDSIPMSLPPGLVKTVRRVQVVSYRNTNPTQYVITGSRILPGEAGAYELIRRLWRRLSRPILPDPPLSLEPAVVGGSGVPRVVIAAADASAMSIGKADYRADGVNDPDVVVTAIGDLSGEVRFTEGSIQMMDRVMVYPDGTYLTGAGRWATTLQVEDITVIDWTFVGTGGIRFLRVYEPSI